MRGRGGFSGGKRKEERGRRKEEGGKRKEEGGKRKEEGGKRKEERGKRKEERGKRKRSGRHRVILSRVDGEGPSLLHDGRSFGVYAPQDDTHR